jgi:hypothetical protein
MAKRGHGEEEILRVLREAESWGTRWSLCHTDFSFASQSPEIPQFWHIRHSVKMV